MGFGPGPLESLVTANNGFFGGFFKGKQVLLTGHTGFKGSWLAFWLSELGAHVAGYGLRPPTDPSLFEHFKLERLIDSTLGDVRDAEALEKVVRRHHPEIIFHLAAQPLVRASYLRPQETFATNVMGTVHLLEAIHRVGGVRVCQIITTDKCYRSSMEPHAYREDDPLGGFDPYSASKACVEFVAASYRNAFFPVESISRHGVSLSTVRAGNVVGGGDWAQDRILPDCIRALRDNQPIVVRNPGAVRPWQYVLDVLAGYLWLAVHQASRPADYAEAWNFAPTSSQGMTVSELVEAVIRHWGGGSWSVAHGSDARFETVPHETAVLRLDAAKAVSRLGWNTVYGHEACIQRTVRWYRDVCGRSPVDACELSRREIEDYAAAARTKGLAWTLEQAKAA